MTTLQFQITPTHTKLTQVARLMGFTTEGVKALAAEVTDEWRSIGRTRSVAGAPGENVLARRPKYYTCEDEECDVFIHGALEFSIGAKGLVLVDDAMRLHLARDAMAREIVARVAQSRSFTVEQLDKVIGEINERHALHQANNSAPPYSIKVDAGEIISPHAPRGPEV